MSTNEPRIYRVAIWFNEYRYSQIVIDPHYEVKHKGSISDELILDLLRLNVDREEMLSDREESKEGYLYYVLHVIQGGRKYRLVFCTHEDRDLFVVLNCFRESKRQ